MDDDPPVRRVPIDKQSHCRAQVIGEKQRADGTGGVMVNNQIPIGEYRMRTTEQNSKFIAAKESERWRANMRREDAFTGYMEYCEQEAASLRVQCFIVRIALIASLMANVIMAMP